MRQQIHSAVIGLLSAMLLLDSGSSAQAADRPVDESSIIKGIRVSGPVTFKNLSVFFLHSGQRDDRRYLTLNEGLEKGLVKVTEREQEEVSKLTIENLSDVPLFLQEGDRVTGGKQDRTIYSSLVIAPKSGKQDIPTFCVEPSRWQKGKTGLAFMCTRNPGYAANNVRQASKLLKSQGIVWENVAQTKAQLMKAIGTKGAVRLMRFEHRDSSGR